MGTEANGTWYHTDMSICESCPIWQLFRVPNLLWVQILKSIVSSIILECPCEKFFHYHTHLQSKFHKYWSQLIVSSIRQTFLDVSANIIGDDFFIGIKFCCFSIETTILKNARISKNCCFFSHPLGRLEAQRRSCCWRRRRPWWRSAGGMRTRLRVGRGKQRKSQIKRLPMKRNEGVEAAKAWLWKSRSRWKIITIFLLLRKTWISIAKIKKYVSVG